jgi:hypothetical protein
MLRSAWDLLRRGDALKVSVCGDREHREYGRECTMRF